MKENVRHREEGTSGLSTPIKIVINSTGPYLVYGKPPLSQQFIMPDIEGNSWEYKQGLTYSTDTTPTALCRCGHSKNQPYCDGSHLTANWDPTLTAENIPLLKDAEVLDGVNIQLTDNSSYCALARFCDAKGKVWSLLDNSADPQARELAIREASNCPAGRLKAWDTKTGKPFEPKYNPSLVLLEDTMAQCSGPIWVRGGIPIDSDTGIQYELRNRVTLCRCGKSSNKPYCDGSHVATKFHDSLPNRAIK